MSEEKQSQPIPIPDTDSKPEKYPPVNLYQLSRLTDTTGILQHAIYTLPNYHEGYTTDDNSRALIVAIYLERLGDEWFTGAQEYASRYLAFMWYAFDRATGKFRNFMGYNREWLEAEGSEDSQGRAIWSLGVVAGRTVHGALREIARTLFGWAMTEADRLISPRAMAFTLLGLDDYLNLAPDDMAVRKLMQNLARRLVSLYRRNSDPQWLWFEPQLTYSNARIPYALLVAGARLENPEWVEIGLTALDWLASIQRSPRGFFSPIGSNGFFFRGRERAWFDQQPIEAAGMVSASLQAYRTTEEKRWISEAEQAFQWFMGANDVQLPLYDPLTGGCRDGLHSDRVNQNQGAESTLSFLLALLELRLFQQTYQGTDAATQPQIQVLPVDGQDHTSQVGPQG